jgi:6-phosphofructokinase 1
VTACASLREFRDLLLIGCALRPLARSPLAKRHWPDDKNFVAPGEFFSRVKWATSPASDPSSASSSASRFAPERLAFLRAGPSETICWDAAEVRAAIVTCGGLACGLNVVIREIVMALWFQYGVRNVLGIRKGYRGFYDEVDTPIRLTPRVVSAIHTQGGTFLGSSRGGFDADKMVAGIRKHKINQVYVIGGDGTHRGALVLSQALRDAGVECAVAGVPKTIDRDIPLIDRTFGFETAIELARHAITCAHTEATSAHNGIGLVKLMGRNAGYIALWASLASRDVNCCLIPEVPFTLAALNKWIEGRLETRGHALIVVAEGCMPTDAGRYGISMDTSLMEKDASGNIKLPDVGELVQKAIKSHFKSHLPAMDVNVKYIDPSYIIRSAPANASDSVFCAELAFAAVHGTMASYTEFTVGTIDGQMSWIPITAVATRPSGRVDPHGSVYSRLVLSTGQPDLSAELPGESAREPIGVTPREVEEGIIGLDESVATPME